MNWNSEELARAANIAKDIALFALSRDAGPSTRVLQFCPETAAGLISGIRDTPAPWSFVPMRHVYRLMGFDECHPFRWRIEHKLIQALVINQFCSASVPVTCGLFRFVHEHLNGCIDPVVLNRELSTVYVKRALGSYADPNNTLETASAVQAVCARSRHDVPDELCDELWIVQERLALVEEYRVHTLESSVVPDLTFLRRGNRPIREERKGPNEFVASVISHLPEAFLAHSLCGWDIGRLSNGRLVVIEVNLGGVHPVIEPGFQCSGFFVNKEFGEYHTARLLQFIEQRYGVIFKFQPGTRSLGEISDILLRISRWLELLRICSLVKSLEVSLLSEYQTTTSSQHPLRSEGSELLAMVVRRLRTIVSALD